MQLENNLLSQHTLPLDLLLKDHTTHRNILWATNSYSHLGRGFGFNDEITLEKAAGIIRPRAVKSEDEQSERIKYHGEVFTPSWVCNLQNNIVDEAWFGRKDVFNVADGHRWTPTAGSIHFPKDKSWKDYVGSKALEISCGEAPYIVSVYDTITGAPIPISERIGMLDRKLRVVGENAATDEDWLLHAIYAVKSIYGYDYQGDNILIARKSVLQSFVDYYYLRFQHNPSDDIIRLVADIISWNIFQMDGLRLVVPQPCDDDSECVYVQFAVWNIDSDEPSDIVEFRELSQRQKIDIVVGNPPYQDMGGSGGSNDAPIFQKFGMASFQLHPRYSSLIIPSRWFAAGRDNLLKDFRNYMLTSGKISRLVAYTNSADIFVNVEIKGGVCYYLYEDSHSGQCEYTLVQKNGEVLTSDRNLDDFDILIRDPRLASIVKKVNDRRLADGDGSVESIISFDTPFGIPSNPKASKKHPFDVSEFPTGEFNTVLYHIEKGVRKTEYVRRCDIRKNAADIDKTKVFVPGAGGSGNDSIVLGRPELAPAGSVCSQSYLYAKFETKELAANFVAYLKTKFLRVLVSAMKITQAANNKVYHFVPLLDMSELWTDKALYKKYGLSDDEVRFVENSIREML